MEISACILNSEEITVKGGLLLKGCNRTTRQPVHLIMLVDTSGSMEEGDKLGSVKKSLRFMISLLSPEDRLSLITFDNDATLVLNKVIPDAANLDATLYKIDKLDVGGSTNMSAALLEARAILEVDSLRKQGILLLTDGHATVGSMTPDALLNITRRILEEDKGVSISTTGYGSDHNAHLLSQIAKEGGGAYNVVCSLEDVASTFGDILGGLVSISAQRVQVKFPHEYTVNTSYPTQKLEDGTTLVAVGDVYAETEIVILFETSDSSKSFQLLGTNMMTLNHIHEIQIAELVGESDYPLAFIIGELKLEVSQFLSRVLQNGRITEADTLRERLMKVTHPIIPFLVADLDQAKKIMASGHMTQEDTIDLTQHSAYIGMSRGLRSVTSPLRNNLRFTSNSQDPDPLTPHVLSPMANAVQRNMTSLMRSMTQDID